MRLIEWILNLFGKLLFTSIGRVSKFLTISDLPLLEKSEIAKRIGTKFNELLDDIAELDRMAAHF